MDFDERLGNPEWVDNWTLGTGPRVEIMERSTRNVWLAQSELSAAPTLPDGFSHALVGGVVADAAYFSRSPEATGDGPLQTMAIDGVRFSFVARPNGHLPVAAGTAVITVDKHHTMLYLAGRMIEILDFGDGTIATPAWSSPLPHPPERNLPPEWSIRSVELRDDLVAVIPNPATVALLNDGSGFHGPLPKGILDD